jgi:hypothetical protein
LALAIAEAFHLLEIEIRGIMFATDVAALAIQLGRVFLLAANLPKIVYGSQISTTSKQENKQGSNHVFHRFLRSIPAKNHLGIAILDFLVEKGACIAVMVRQFDQHDPPTLAIQKTNLVYGFLSTGRLISVIA